MLNQANQRSPPIGLLRCVLWNAVKHLTLWETTGGVKLERGVILLGSELLSMLL